MNQPFIFTEIYNCAKIGRIAIESFHKHHNLKVHIFGLQTDFDALGEIKSHPNNVFIDMTSDANMAKYCHSGHKGTSYIFALVFYGVATHDKKIIHFDGDTVFKTEAVSVITDAFAKGYDIIASRRCMENNPGGAPGFEGVPDTIGTCMFGFNRDKIDTKKYEFGYFRQMCEGTINHHPHKMLDFFDPVTFDAIYNDAKILFTHPDVFGGQDEHGKKESSYKSNLHMDMGRHIMHLGGVGTGYVWHNHKKNTQPGYAEWAMGKYSLFAKVFYNEDIGYRSPTVYGPDGRWINGNYDDNIYNTLMEEMEK